MSQQTTDLIDMTGFQRVSGMDHVWVNPASGLHYFTDEAYGCNGPFDTADEAQAAMKHYAKHILGT